MNRLTFRCPHCAREFLAPPSFVGADANCPKCGARVAEWRPAGAPAPPVPKSWSEPAPAPRNGSPPEAGPNKDRQPPDGLVLVCYLLAAGAAVTLFLPCLWLFAAPLAAGGLVASVYILRSKYRAPAGVAASFVVSVVILLISLARANEVNETLRRLGDGDDRRR